MLVEPADEDLEPVAPFPQHLRSSLLSRAYLTCLCAVGCGRVGFDVQDGALDPNFAPEGYVVVDTCSGVSDSGSDIIRVGNHLVVSGTCGGGFLIARLDLHGELDTTFGVQGRTVTQFSAQTDRGTSLAILSDGRYVVAGPTSATDSRAPGQDFGVAGYDSNGRLAAQDFGTPDGFVVYDSGIMDRFGQMALLMDDTILLAGTQVDGGYTPTLVWLDRSGQLLSSVQETSLPGGFRSIESIAVLPDERIAVTEWTSCGLLVFGSSGSLDTSFGNGGEASLGLDAGCNCGPIVLSDGGILVGGQLEEVEEDLVLVRFTADGQPDPAFGEQTGYTAVSLSTGLPADENCNDLVVQPDGKILMLASTMEGNWKTALLRFTSDGRLDPTFGAGDGVISFERGLGDDVGAKMLLDGNHLYVVGSSSNGNDLDLLIARFELTFE